MRSLRLTTAVRTIPQNCSRRSRSCGWFSEILGGPVTLAGTMPRIETACSPRPPICAPRSSSRSTPIRIQHVGGLTEERRRLRFQKYREADPDCIFQKSYANLIAPRRDVKRWQPRLPNLPVVSHDRAPDLRPQEKGEPVVSVIVISQNDEATIERSLQAIVSQDGADPFEVIVVNSGTDDTATLVRKNFPEVKLVKLGPPALPGRARNAGLRIARGRFVTFPGSHIELLPGSLAARVAAHRLGYGLVTGTMGNGTRTW